MSEGTRQDTDVVVGLLGSDAATFLMATHELKSPLALVRQLAFALENDELSSADYQHIAQQIRLTTERALRLTSDITRSSRGDSLFELEPLNPVTICEEVAHELAPLYAAQNKSIQVKSRTRPPLLVGNRDLLKRILLNFGDNALHYAPGVQVTTFNVAQFGDQVRVGIRDFGPAVPTDVWRELSRRLQLQTVQPLSVRPQSSGLGLYIAGQFAKMMQAEIGAVRHRDGATFYVDMTRSHQLSLL